jgi:DNA-binding transcriptional ArsR family regulator
MSADLAALESLFLGLADKTRLRLLALMAAGPVSVGHLVTETGDSQPKISRHLAYLRNAGLVDTTRDGKWIYYGVANLPDGSADSVFRCVVDELNEKRGIKKPNTVHPSIVAQELPVEGPSTAEEPAYEATEPAMHWERPSDEPHQVGHNELDVFLL